MNVDCSFIIVNYKTKELTAEAVDSVFYHTQNLSFEIIVIDNCSSDGSFDYLKNTFGDKIILIEAEQNKGFGSANNLGVKKASGKYVFLLNSDAYLLSNAARFFFDYLEENNEVAVCGSQLVSKSHEKVVTYGNFPSVTELIFRLGPRFICKRYYRKKLQIAIADAGNQLLEVDYVSGAAFFISRKLYEETNGFDEDFFLYYEETEFCYRLKKLGYKMVVIPEIKIVHLMGASSSSDTFNFNKFAMVEDSRKLFFRKSYGSFFLIISNFLEAANTLVFDILSGRSSKSTLLKIKKIINL